MIQIGTSVVDRAPVEINLQRLIETRLLVNANSGAGKSWTIRRLLEQSFGKVQHLVIDPEGEYRTLRDKFDYVLAGHEGDTPAHPASASLLCRRLLELGASAVLDIYELKMDERRRFVRLFLESLVNAPRGLWHPVLVIVDEAHIFAPQDGSSESTQSVIDLMTRGRKRGFCGVPATQRFSKIHKDAIAECNNMLIGRTSLDIDMKRAGDILGFSTAEDKRSLRTLKDGNFYAFGPAISTVPVEITVGPVETRHPKAGERALPPAAPRKTIIAVLGKLADLPKEAEREADELSAARKRIADLERTAKETAPAIDPAEMQRAEQRGYQRAVEESRAAWSPLADAVRKLASIVPAELEWNSNVIDDVFSSNKAPGPKPTQPVDNKQQGQKSIPSSPPAKKLIAGPGENLPRGERKVLTALAQYPNGRRKTQIAILTGYAHNGGGFNNSLSSLRSKGYIAGSDPLAITDAGLKALGSYDPLPTGPALREHWMGQLGKAESLCLQALIDAYPRALSKEELANRAGYASNGGGFNNALSHLRTLELISGKGELKASEDLF